MLERRLSFFNSSIFISLPITARPPALSRKRGASMNYSHLPTFAMDKGNGGSQTRCDPAYSLVRCGCLACDCQGKAEVEACIAHLRAS
jgi:hypothetical protein